MRTAISALVLFMWAAVLVGGAFRPQSGAAGSEPRPQAGYPAPDLTAVAFDGQPVSLSSLRGQAVFLNFWASWCGPCRLEMPEVQRLAAGLPPGTAVLTVNMTGQESSPAAVEQFLQARGYTFPVALDLNGSAGETYGVLSLPTSLFISPEGVVTARVNGPLSHAAMLDYLKNAAGR
ncbi:MAG TPA: TlpA disulfide reductase family protein [Symbiobacteriaceae bacterium]|nr:TlpA disulfide reductase family protein [Symbiobacteriaceae bacterium]